MAKVWFAWAIMMSVQIVLISASNCSNVDIIRNCNECIRCGGHWCNDPKETNRCIRMKHDAWCPEHEEDVAMESEDRPGDLLNPAYSERTVLVGKLNELSISYQRASKPMVEITIVNTTQNNELSKEERTNCKKGQCTTVVTVFPYSDFCSATARVSEFVSMKVKFEGLSEEANVKYKVPCACACSEKVEKNSKECNGRGDYSCGVCFCQDGWTGNNCEKIDCGPTRGDVQMSSGCVDPTRSNDVKCSGNGYCNACETCVCYTDRYGSMYFDKDLYCADICTTISDCPKCLKDPTPGKCPFCDFTLTYQIYNDTVAAERDDFNRSIWIKCNETLEDGYYIEYIAMRDEVKDFYFMFPPNGGVKAAIGGGGVSVTVPIVLGVIAMVAAGVVTAGYFVWKNRLPPVPLTDPMYTNIDAEDSTGENPLYKPPTSSFKNPTYGKW